MRRALLLLTLVLGACEAQTPAAPPRPRDVAPAPPAVTPVAAPTSPPPTPLGTELAPQFPFVRIQTRTSFAHDRGDETTIERVEVAGKPCPPDDALANIVAHWKGWTAAGGRSDEDVLRTTQTFIEAWNRHLDVKTVTDAAAPPDLAPLLARRAAPLGPPGPPALAYHPPRYELRDDGGERLVVASYFVKGHISQRGQHWSYEVSAFRVRDGARHRIPPDSTLPQPLWFSEGD